MKKQFLKIAGVKTEDEFYNKYPSEEDFFKAHPEALKQLARGGEAFFMKHGGAISKLLVKAQDGLWFQDPNKQALYDAETRYIEANQRGANYNPDAAKAYEDILMMDPSATDIRQKVDSLNNVYPYYSSSFQQVPFKGGFGKYGNRTNEGWEATQQLYNKEKQKPSIIPMDFSEPEWKGSVKKAMGGTTEAYPQIATFDKAFSYGVPVPPTYYAHGGAFPMAQSEEQFFSPYYGNIPNPYNKAMGGSAYPQSMSFPYGDTGPSTHFMMQDGGYMPEEEPLPRMGVKGYLTDFIGAVKNTAAKKINDNLALHGAVKNPEQYDFEQARYGGNLKSYQSQNTQANTDNSNSDKGTSGSGVVNNYYYGTQGTGQQLPPEYQNDIDYIYGRRRPVSDFNIKGKGLLGNYRSTGWLKDEYGLEGLRDMGMTAMSETNPRWYQLLKRPSKTYYFGQQGVPGQVDQQGMPTGQGAGQQDPGKGMGFLARMFNRSGNIAPQPGSTTNVSPNQQVAGDARISQRNNQMWNPEFTDWRNQSMQNRLGRINTKLDNLEAHEAWQQKQLGNENIGLSGWRGRQRDRLLNRAGNIENKMTNYKGYSPPQQKYGGLIQYQSKNTQGTVKLPDGREVPVANQKFNDKTAFKKSMTVDEYLRSRSTSPELQEQIKVSNQQDNPTGVVIDRGTPQWRPGQSAPVAQTAAAPSQSSSYAPSFDEQLAKDIISSNEQNYFGTKSVLEPFDPSKHSLDWRQHKIDNFPGEPYKKPGVMDTYWDRMFGENGEKTKQLNYFNDMPAPLKTVAADILYNQKTDPRAILLAAAGVPGKDVVYSMEGEDGKSYRQDLRKNVDDLWNKNKDMILQQYNDDPRAFTDAFSDYRDVYMQKTRSADRTSNDPKDAHLYDLYVREKNDPHVIETDTWGDTGLPGTQYKAWRGRTDNTRQMVDDKYFGPNSGYVAPKFFARGGSYNTGDVVDMTPEEIQKFIAMGGQVEFLD